MERQENGVYFTLFKTNHSGNNMYSIQLNTEFSAQSFEANGYRIISKPENEMETLMLQLFVSPGNSSHIEHSFDLGFFPNNVNKWRLKVEYIDDQNQTIIGKEVNVVQAEGEAEPKPVIEGSLG